MDLIIEWTDALSVGVEEIDRDHQQLVAMINKLFGACLVPETEAAAVKAILDELIAYTRDHFDREIRLQEEMGYPEVDEHRALHQELIDKANALRAELDETSANAMGNAVERLLRDWLVEHIMGHDKPLGDYIRAQKTN